MTLRHKPVNLSAMIFFAVIGACVGISSIAIIG